MCIQWSNRTYSQKYSHIRLTFALAGDLAGGLADVLAFGLAATGSFFTFLADDGLQVNEPIIKINLYSVVIPYAFLKIKHFV